MFQIVLMFFVWVGVLGSCADIQAMKRSRSQELEQANNILSLPAEIHCAIVACSQDKNALNLTCKAFHKWASYDNWKTLLSTFYTTLYLSQQDQERMGAILLDSNDLVLMKKLLARYPEYVIRVPQFTINTPLSDASSENMKQLLITAAKELGDVGFDKQTQTFSEETQGVSFAYFTNDIIAESSKKQAEQQQAQELFRAVIKGDFEHIEEFLRSSDRVKKEICDNRMMMVMNHALELASTYGYYKITELLLKQPLFQDKQEWRGHIRPGPFAAALGDIDPVNVASQCIIFKRIRPHEKVAELIIKAKQLEEEVLDNFITEVIESSNPAILKIYLEVRSQPVELDDLELAIQQSRDTGREEIAKLVAKKYSSQE